MYLSIHINPCGAKNFNSLNAVHYAMMPEACFTKEINPSLVKQPLNFNGSLAKLQGSSLVWDQPIRDDITM